MVTITFLDKNFDEIETTVLNESMLDAISVIHSTTEFKVGTDNLRYEKTGWTSIDFKDNEIEVQLNFE